MIVAGRWGVRQHNMFMGAQPGGMCANEGTGPRKLVVGVVRPCVQDLSRVTPRGYVTTAELVVDTLGPGKRLRQRIWVTAGVVVFDQTKLVRRPLPIARCAGVPVLTVATGPAAGRACEPDGFSATYAGRKCETHRSSMGTR